ncbi:hypothetical protein J6590_107401 [Homalodisca vitripennis]|nr:hypothetical protein J6590_107401 [Homalodisca vitripennis]
MNNREGENEEDFHEEQEVQSKKRQRTPSQWKRNKTKVARLKGEEYEDYRGRLVPKLAEGQLCR